MQFPVYLSRAQMHIVAWLIGSALLHLPETRCDKMGLSVGSVTLWDSGACVSSCSRHYNATALVAGADGLYVKTWTGAPILRVAFSAPWPLGPGSIASVGRQRLAWANSTHTCIYTMSDSKPSVFCINSPVKSSWIITPAHSISTVFCYVGDSKDRHPCFDAGQMEVTRSGRGV
jgi:hypothetical protein